MENIYRTEISTDSYFMDSDFFTKSSHRFMQAAIDTLIDCGMGEEIVHDLGLPSEIVTLWENEFRYEKPEPITR